MTILADRLESQLNKSYRGGSVKKEPYGFYVEPSGSRREIEHALRTPLTILTGYLSMVVAGDVKLSSALPLMMDAAEQLLAAMFELEQEYQLDDA